MNLQWSIRVWLAVLVLVIALPLIAMLAYDSYAQTQEDARRAGVETLGLAQLVAAETRLFFADAEHTLADLAQRPAIRTADPAHCDPLLDGFLEHQPEFANLSVANRDGLVICSQAPAPGGHVASIADTPEFRDVMRKDAFVIGDPGVGPIAGERVSALAYPLHDDAGQLVGALRLAVDLERFQRMFSTVTLPPGAVITIVAGDGTIVARSLDPELWNGKNARGAEIIETALPQTEGHVQARGPDDIERIYAFTTIIGSDWRVFVGILPEIAFDTTRIQTLRNGLMGLALILIVVGLAVALSRQITGPMRALARATIAATQGRWDVRAPVAGPAEVAEVAARFNALLDARAVAEAALRQSEERFAKAFQASPMAMTISTLAGGRYIDANERFLDLIGYTYEELLDHTVFDLGIWVDVDQRAQLVRSLEKQHPVRDSEVYFRSKSGAVRETLVSIEVIDLDGEACLLALIQDMTERRRIEAALQEHERAYAMLLRDIAGMAYRCRNDTNWTMELVSDGSLALTGYPAQDLIENQRAAFGDLIHPDDAESLWDKRQASLAARRPCSNEYRIRTASSEEKWVWDQAHGIYTDAGELLAIEGIVTDITERKGLEAQFLQAQKMEGIGQLAGGIAHDFNNLLTAITGYAELAIESLPGDHPVRSDLDDLIKAAGRASKLTRQLLTFARKQAIDLQVLNLNDLLLELSRLLRRLIGADIELVLLPALDSMIVKIDPSQIEQVLVNLVVNARDAMPQGGKLTIETHGVLLEEEDTHHYIGLPPGRYVFLAIRDSGIGMDEQVQSHVFEPFFTTKGPDLGTGLGLATCYGVIKQHGGHIAIDSEVGHGTTVRIHLPRITEAATALWRHDETPALPQGHEVVLLVEDEPAVRALAARVLRQQGYRVLEAANGDEALRVVREHAAEPIALLLADMVMPQMGGQALAEQLTLMRPTIRVLFMSGYTDTVINQRNQLISEAAFLQKPFSLEGLARKVREVLDS